MTYNELVKEVERIINKMNRYKSSNELINNDLFKRISRCHDDLRNISPKDSPKDFILLISTIDTIIECSKELLKQINKDENYKIEKTDSVIYFKFIRDFLCHPAGLNSDDYKKEPYKDYAWHNVDGEKIKPVCAEYYEDMSKQISYLGFSEKSLRYLFGKEEYEESFALWITIKKQSVWLVCPYEKLFQGLIDVMHQLLNDYKNSEEISLKEE